MHLDKLHCEFLTYLEIERNYSPLTIVSYRSDFVTFLRFLSSEGLPHRIGTVERATVRQYIGWLRNNGLKPTTVARRINSLRSFWRYLRDCEYTGGDPFTRISLPKRSDTTPQHLTTEEARHLLDAAQRQDCLFNGFRDTAVLAVLRFTGVRRSELLALTLQDVDLPGGTVQVLAGKGRRARVIPLLEAPRTAVGDWLELRPDCKHDRIFTSKWGAPLSKNGLASALARALAGAEVTRTGITLHSLRHTFACLLLKGGCDLYSLQRMLGHSRLDTTATYLHATVEDLRVAAERHPLAD